MIPAAILCLAVVALAALKVYATRHGRTVAEVLVNIAYWHAQCSAAVAHSMDVTLTRYRAETAAHQTIYTSRKQEATNA